MNNLLYKPCIVSGLFMTEYRKSEIKRSFEHEQNGLQLTAALDRLI